MIAWSASERDFIDTIILRSGQAWGDLIRVTNIWNSRVTDSPFGPRGSVI